MKSCAILFLLVLWLGAVSVEAENCFVTGTVVDKNGNQLSGARVVAYTPPEGWEDLIVANAADASGRFSAEIACKSDNSFLFVTPPLDFQKNFIPISPPVWIDGKGYNNVFGRRLPRIKKGSLDVGRVVAPDYYKIEIEFVDERGNAFLPADLPDRFWLRIKTADGKEARSGGISQRDEENAKTAGKSSLLMTLPEGKWIVEISFNEDEKPYFYPDKIVDLSNVAANEPQKTTLRMSKDKKIK